MKKVIFVIATFVMILGLTSCEPRVYEHPSNFIGYWQVENDIFHEVEFLENKTIVSNLSYGQDMKNGSVYAKREFFCTAKRDTLEFGFFENAMFPPKGPYICTYYFENNNKLVIKGFNQVLYHGDLTQIVRDMEAEIILTRKK